MRPLSFDFRAAVLCAFLLGGGLTLPGRAQAPSPAPSATPEPTPALVERTVYTPYEQLEAVFQKEDRGVFLPYREFLDLWNKLNLPADLQKANVPPVDGVLASARYTGRVEGEAAVFDAALQLEALKDGWTAIPLGSTDLNIAEVKPVAGAASGVSAPTLYLAKDGYEAIVPAKGSYALPLRVLGKVVRDAGRATLNLRLPRTAAAQFELTIPDTGLDFTLTPASAFTTKEENGATVLTAFFGTTEEVAVSWRKRAAETTLPPLVFAETTLSTNIEPGVLRTGATLDFRLLRAGVGQFRLLVPAGQQVLAVEGADLRDWNADGGADVPAGRQRILVNLAAPARETYRLKVTLEAPIAALPAKLPAPGVEVEGAEGQSGTVSLAADPALDVTVDPREGATRQGSQTTADGEHPEVPNGETFLGTYRFLRLPYAVDLAVRAAEPVVEVEANTLLTVEPDLLELHSALNYTVKKAGIFSVLVDVPAAWTHLEAQGPEVESYAVLPPTPTGGTDGPAPGTQRLEVRFRERLINPFSVQLTADLPRNRPDEPLTAAPPRPVGVARAEGALAVAVNTGLDPNTTSPGDLRQSDVGSLNVPRPHDPAKDPITFGFRFRGDAPKPPVIAFTQRKPRVSAEVHSRVALHESLVSYRWTVDYRIEYAGVDEFVLDAPPDVADDLQFDGEDIKEKAREDEKDAAGKATGRKLWHVRLQQKHKDRYVLDISVERPLPALSAGKTATVPWPELKTVGLFHETGTVAVVKDGNLEITRATPTGLELIDPQEIAANIGPTNRATTGGPEEVFLAYRYAAHPAALTLEFSKNEFLPVPTALVTYAVLNTVLTADRAETTEAIYWVRNNGRQFLSVVLPERGQMLSDVFVNGQGQQPARRPDNRALLVRLPARVAGGGGTTGGNGGDDAPVSVRLVYAVPGVGPAHGGGGLGTWGHLHFTPPVLEDTRVLQTEASLYLPSGYRYVRFESAMRETYERGWSRWKEVFDPLVPNLGPSPDNEPAAVWQTPPTLPPMLGGGFDSVLPKEGTPVVLRRLDAPDAVDISYRSLGWANTVEAAAFFLALLGGLLLLGSSRGARLTYFFVVGIGSLVVAGAVVPRAAGVWTALYLGVLLAAFVWLLSWPVGVLRRWSHLVRERRRRLRTWLDDRLRRRRPPGPGGGSPPPPTPPTTPTPSPAA